MWIRQALVAALLTVTFSVTGAVAQSPAEGLGFEHYNDFVVHMDSDSEHIDTGAALRACDELNGHAVNEALDAATRSEAYTLYAAIMGRLARGTRAPDQARHSFRALRWALHFNPDNLRAIASHAEAVAEIRELGMLITDIAASTLGIDLEEERQYALNNLRTHSAVPGRERLLTRLQ